MNEKIWFYNQLSQEEQAKVEQHVAQHPELMPLLEEAKTLGVLLHDKGSGHADPLVDEALAYFIATRGASTHPLPDSLQWAFHRIEERLATDANLRLRYDEVARRLQALEAASDPLRQFERLSGIQLPQLSRPPRPQPAMQEETAVPSGIPEGSSRAHLTALRRPVSLRTAMRYGFGIVGIVVFCFVCYRALVFLSNATEPALEHIAASAPPSFADNPVVNLRGGVSEMDAERAVAQADSLWRAARSDIFGLFPRYDAALLGEAARLLDGVVDEVGVDPLAHEEAAYRLAKVRLVQRDETGARAMLDLVVEEGRYNVDQARAVLQELDALSAR